LTYWQMWPFWLGKRTPWPESASELDRPNEHRRDLPCSRCARNA
jgi:hypothetical protein